MRDRIRCIKGRIAAITRNDLTIIHKALGNRLKQQKTKPDRNKGLEQEAIWQATRIGGQAVLLADARGQATNPNDPGASWSVLDAGQTVVTSS